MLATRFPGWAIPDVVRAVYHTDIGEIKGVMAHPVLLRHKNTTPGTFMEALESGFPLITMAMPFGLSCGPTTGGTVADT